MKLITKEIEEKLVKYPYGSQDGKMPEEVEVIVKYFNPIGVGTWIATELDEKTDDDIIFYGVAELGYGFEWGTFSLKELENISLPYGMTIERDLYCGNKLSNLLSEDQLQELGFPSKKIRDYSETVRGQIEEKEANGWLTHYMAKYLNQNIREISEETLEMLKEDTPTDEELDILDKKMFNIINSNLNYINNMIYEDKEKLEIEFSKLEPKYKGSLLTALGVMSGIELRNLQRKNINLAEIYEITPFTLPQEEVILKYGTLLNEHDSLCDYAERNNIELRTLDVDKER